MRVPQSPAEALDGLLDGLLLLLVLLQCPFVSWTAGTAAVVAAFRCVCRRRSPGRAGRPSRAVRRWEKLTRRLIRLRVLRRRWWALGQYLRQFARLR